MILGAMWPGRRSKEEKKANDSLKGTNRERGHKAGVVSLN